jgi:hypothetical protein
VKRLYVGNLPIKAGEEELRNWFAQNGFHADRVEVIRDRYTGESRGFGFVEMSDEEAERAIQTLNGHDFMGRGGRRDWWFTHQGDGFLLFGALEWGVPLSRSYLPKEHVPS